MYLTSLFLPLLGSLVTGFGGRWLGYYGASIIASFCVFFSMFFSILIFFEVGLSNFTITFSLANWFESGILKVNWSFLFDNLTATMLMVITSISFFVHLYSIEYMKTDPHFPRFMAYLEIFTFFMLILVTADNVVQMFVGWEGVGLTSYLLINFWTSRLNANKSALKALIVNRIGDFGLTLSVIIIFFLFKSINYTTIFSLTPFFLDHHINFINFKIHSLTLIGIFLTLGAVGKSAQLGLHTWLPDAMEGPTPVSALIHAATMVTAGVFLIIRFSPLIEFSGVTLLILITFGSLTAFFAALTGVFQHDLKKVIAYSTCSQLGYMIFCCGLSCYHVSIFHLFNHAFFKALLFLSAGSIIHAILDEQDMRRMGSLVNFLPGTYSLMLIGSLSLAGFPFLTGFYSKDIILEISSVFRNNNLNIFLGSFSCWLGNLSVFFTAYYSFRLLYLTFLNNTSCYRVVVPKISEPSFLILFPLIILSFGSIFLGWFTKEFFIGLGVDSWSTALFNFPTHLFFIESELTILFFKWLPFLLTIFGIIFATVINLKIFKTKLKFNYLCFLINKKWYFDVLYNKLIVFPILHFGYFISFKNLDRGFIELIGPYGFSVITIKLTKIFSQLQTGQLSHYLFFITFSACLMLNFVYLKFNLLTSLFYFILFYFI